MSITMATKCLECHPNFLVTMKTKCYNAKYTETTERSISHLNYYYHALQFWCTPCITPSPNLVKYPLYEMLYGTIGKLVTHILLYWIRHTTITVSYTITVHTHQHLGANNWPIRMQIWDDWQVCLRWLLPVMAPEVCVCQCGARARSQTKGSMLVLYVSIMWSNKTCVKYVVIHVSIL